MTLAAKGTNGALAFDGTFVTISRTGLSRFTVGKGDKRIPLQAISGLEWKPAGGLVYGYLQVTIPGGVERRSQFGTRTWDAYHDENTVTFTKLQQPLFEQVRAAIEQALARPTPTAAPSVASELDKLADLLQRGVLSQQEFDQQKARLLNG